MELLGKLQKPIVLHFGLYLLFGEPLQEDFFLACAVVVVAVVNDDLVRLWVDIVEWVEWPFCIYSFLERTNFLVVFAFFVNVAFVVC